MTKNINTDKIADDLKESSVFFRDHVPSSPPPIDLGKPVSKPMETPMDSPVENITEDEFDTSKLPSKEELEILTLRSRELPQANLVGEIPREWLKELDDLARAIGVKNVRVYRYMTWLFVKKLRKMKKKNDAVDKKRSDH